MDGKKTERAVLAGLSARTFSDHEDCSYETLDELEALLETAGGECVGKVMQNRDAPDPATLIGEGKAIEIGELAEREEADLVIFDNELSPSQARNLSELIGRPVLDRSALILDIFAGRASTSEGRLQVELAQYRYVLSKLSGIGTALSRLGGGIGTRGPGETKLETDRRHIRRHIRKLEEEFEKIRRVRAVARARRQRERVPVVALVGYTNAGKSTLLNALCGAGVEANDRLFDTLDPTTRKYRLPSGQTVLFSDTVGFIRKLPTGLVEAFRATLEELAYAELLLHVIDASNPQWPEEKALVERVLRDLKAESIPRIEVFNKSDRADGLPPLRDGAVAISARTGEGIDRLTAAVEAALARGKRRVSLVIPYSESARLDRLYRDAIVESADYRDEGIFVTATLTDRSAGSVDAFIVRHE